LKRCAIILERVVWRAGLCTLASIAPVNPVLADPDFQFTKTKIADQDSATTCTLGPDGHLYVADLNGQIVRYQLDGAGQYQSQSDVVVTLTAGFAILGLAFDPAAQADDLKLWVSYQTGPPAGTVVFIGRISRFDIPPVGSPGPATEQQVIVGLPVGHHANNDIAFGPDGMIYIPVGSMTPRGGTKWGRDETLLSAAVLRADVTDAGFGSGGGLPVDIQTDAPTSYDPFAPNAPVTLYATGLRNAYDLAWHTNGHLYAGINQADTPDAPTPPCGGAAAINSFPPEVLARVIQNNYYGHPNPTRSECVLNGGNPTGGADPWEAPEYPTGTMPHPDFDPALFYNVLTTGGISPNGIAEYTAPGPLQGRLLMAYFGPFSGVVPNANRIQTFALDGGGTVTGDAPLLDETDAPLTFLNPLDVTVHSCSGTVYVAAYGQYPDNRGQDGAVWACQPLAVAAPVPADVDCDRDVDGVDFATFASCFNGSGKPPRTLGCTSAQSRQLDSDSDTDVDGVDFSKFASCFNGAGKPPRSLGCPQY
jgi:hypothetical protein